MRKEESYMEKIEKKLVECPFYRKNVEKGIRCEGLRGSTSLQVNFLSLRQRKDFMEGHCCSMDWENCPLAKVLYAKYD